jgi:hypothetical protein
VTDVALRPAVAADVPAIARIWREGWADGHEGHVPDALAAERTPASFDRRTIERIGHTWVAERAGTVAGFVVVMDAEVEQIYVDRRWGGRGVAGRLLGHAEAVIGQGGRRTAHRYEREVGGSTLPTTSRPRSLVRRRWPTLAGLGFAALIAVDLTSGVELAPVLAASAAVYLGAAVALLVSGLLGGADRSGHGWRCRRWR